MVNNLQINFAENLELKKNLLHKLVFFLKRDLKFEISSLVINFIPSDQILTINKQYLNHHFTTDIITFNYSGNHKILDGELYISIEDAENNAAKYGVSVQNEYFRLVIHGILHLLDYDDQQKSAKLVMKRLENKLLKSIAPVLLKSGKLA